MNPLQWMSGKAKAADQWIADEALKRVASRNDAAAKRLMDLGPEHMARRHFSGREVPEAKVENLAAVLAGENAMRPEARRQRFAEQLAARSPGPLRMIDQGIAENPWVRRGALPTAVVGGGAMLTAGAQQLLQLMGLLEQAKSQQVAADESPLNVG